jgi:hypothetical protein
MSLCIVRLGHCKRGHCAVESSYAIGTSMLENFKVFIKPICEEVSLSTYLTKSLGFLDRVRREMASNGLSSDCSKEQTYFSTV